MTPFQKWTDGLDWGDDETIADQSIETEDLQLKLEL